MKIKLSKSQWERVGSEAGWLSNDLGNDLSQKIDIYTAQIKAILLDPEKNQYQKRQEVKEIMEKNRDIFPV